MSLSWGCAGKPLRGVGPAMNERQRVEVWTVDPAMSLQSVLDDPRCPPLARRGLKGPHSWQVRNEMTVERTLRASHLLPQWIAALLALGAAATLDGGEGPTDIAVDALVTGERKGEIRSLHIPAAAAIRWGEAHVARTPADKPVVAAFAVVEMHDDTVRAARVALTGVWSPAVRLAETPDALVGGPLTAEKVGEAVTSVEREIEPQSDYLGSSAYRRAMAGVLTRRALEVCMRREVADE